MLLLVVGSGCSLREVQLWFSVDQHVDITRDQARSIADQVNAKRAPGGCDGNYAGACVPDNATTAHCLGAAGDGPSIRGPLTVAGWDPFELDPDGDRRACVDPVGNLDTFGQQVNGIGVAGWTLDPETSDPIAVAITDNGITTQSLANASRGDLAPFFPGSGIAHGFETLVTANPGAPRQVCVVALNVGAGANTNLGCKSIQVLAIGDRTDAGIRSVGVIEQADFVSTGLRVRGFAFSPNGPVDFYLSTSPATLLDSTGVPIQVRRPDVQAWSSAAPAVSGFDLVLPRIIPQICLNYLVSGHVGTFGCRAVGS